ncbi:PREDICTED: uncharacterized protein LOC109207350 isoform X1 [Nicotiana attenuata]|uniref:uncharacterized protein LOC109207350 isoform X1 n=1 Tax=Nicotiana attenuata TaxID=49451 RepID=UPI00090528EB|nr:PREDICTED: uncharacterized protein LOC109207350 isoform X1 [Nicotiana attenuata]XP_019225796.1 PREDICTED: uncharacterized protein LOC109207350 isoform X1 [Nicotiana attenuata]
MNMNTKQVEESTPPCTAEEGRFSGGGDGEDEAVECELEAAQTLACLAGCSKGQAIAMPPEQESELKTSPRHALKYLRVASRRSRQNLTEEEREERRLSRVLANRESARQTIRRRQAMYEELTKKEADLALENENLKKTKELAAKEYESLKNENTNLRIQVAKIEKAEVEETDCGSKSKPVQISSTSTAPTPTPTPSTIPASLFNQSPITPFFWPSIVQPFNGILLQCGSQNISDITSVLPLPTSVELNSINRQESSTPGNPLFVLPLPCLIPFHPQSSNLFLPWSSTLTDKHTETSSVHQRSTSYLNTENNRAAIAAKTDAPESVKATQRDFLHEAELRFPPEGGASKRIWQPSSSHIQLGTSERVSSQQDNAPDIRAVSCTVGHVTDTSEKTSQECITSSSKNPVDAHATAEARKRRKELLKLRSQHSDQFGRHH